MRKLTLFVLIGLLIASCSNQKGSNFVTVDPDDTYDDIIRKAAHVVPSERQLNWQDLEFTAFCHFGVNTFTDREWGTGTEDPGIFNPTDFDASQWVSTFKEAGMKMVIVTAKHHDGFCLWQSEYTDHSVKSSPWKNGKGDIVREVSDACREAGLKFGVYLSPWDRHEQTYGTDEYNDHFVNQLTELLTKYGVVDEVWFDGANGEGPNGKRQVYDWLRYYRTIRELQPQATIAVMGPDVRWVGTESGYGRVMEWSVVPYESTNTDNIAEVSQQVESDGVYIPMGDKMAPDLGSRSKILKAKALVWYPSEVDVSIRPGWFYHEYQDEQVKSPEKLLDIWFSSVGRNSLLLLNVPPDKRGLIHENDVKSLLELKKIRDVIFNKNFLEGADIKSTTSAFGKGPSGLVIPGRDRYWMAGRGKTEADIEFNLDREETFDCLVLQENIELGQRVEQFSLEIWTGERWKEITRSTTIGYKRMLRFSPQTAQKLRLRILQSRWMPALSYVGLYKRLPGLDIDPGSGAFSDQIEIEMKTGEEGNNIYYTLDGSDPTEFSLKYTGPVTLDKSATLRAIAIDKRGVSSFIREGNYTKATFSLNFRTPPSPKYPGKDQLTIVDGRKGFMDFAGGEWLGWEGDDMVVTIDYNEIRELKKASADFLHDQGSWIFYPVEVIFETSMDGKNYSQWGRSLISEPWDLAGAKRKEFSASGKRQARYVRITARNIGTCPMGHAGEGGKAWVFCDEITIE
jgi:alpha-L-fucosidase